MVLIVDPNQTLGGTYSRDNTKKAIGVDNNVVGVTNSGEDNSYCGGHSVGHGVVYSEGVNSNCEGCSVVHGTIYSRGDYSNGEG